MEYDKKSIRYKPPWRVMLTEPSLLLEMLIVPILIIAVLSAVLPGDIYRVLVQLLLIPCLLVLVFGLLRRFLLRKSSTPLTNWILENVRCPACSGRLKSCVLGQPAYMRVGRSDDNNYTVQCRNCIKKFVFNLVPIVFNLVPIMPGLYLIGEIDERMDKKYGEVTQKAARTGFIVILIIFGAIVLVILFIIFMMLVASGL